MQQWILHYYNKKQKEEFSRRATYILMNRRYTVDVRGISTACYPFNKFFNYVIKNDSTWINHTKKNIILNNIVKLILK